MIDSNISARGTVTVEVHDAATGELRSTMTQSNLVTTVGLDLLADLLAGTGTIYPTHVAVGTDATAPVAGNTTIGTEVYRGTIVQSTSSGGVVTYKLLIGSGSANGNTLAEAGLLTAASGGILFAHTLFSSTISKTSSDTVTITWTVTLADA